MAESTIKSRIYNAIWNDIIDGVYDWDYVFNEKNLVAKYGVSKSPVRDALLELCKDNVLRSIPRYGYEIVRIPEKQLREMIEMRVLIETAGLRKCFVSIGGEKIDALREYNLRSRLLILNKSSTARDLWDDNMQFHRQLYSFSNNEFGMALLDRCMQMQTMAYIQLYCFTRDTNKVMTTTSHERIEQLIENGDCEGAVLALQNDIRSILPSEGTECTPWS